MEWFDEEMEALEIMLADGHINREQFLEAVNELARDAQDQQTRDDIIAAGRGHLIQVR